MTENAKDIIRDRILRTLYDFSQKSLSAKKVAVLPSVLEGALRDAYGYKKHDIASNLDYLVQKDYVKQVVTTRTFTTKQGTAQNSEQITYKISAAGVDLLEDASLFRKPAVGAHVNITNINGVVTVGDGNVVNAKFTDLSRLLTEARNRLAAEATLSDQQRLDVLSDLDGLSAQLQKPHPNVSVVRALWESVKAVGAVGSAAEVLHKAAHLIAPLLQ